jgi:5-methylcytosine-specific restriction endonuclease McrA
MLKMDISEKTLILNATYEPINVVSWCKAITLLYLGKVEVLEEYDKEVHSISLAIKVPSVLKLMRHVLIKRKRNLVKFSRLNIFIRDKFTCQYCGEKFKIRELTIDHVIPLNREGLSDWENIVTACRTCNNKKGGKTPKEAGMQLIRPPRRPYWLLTSLTTVKDETIPENWKAYLMWK